MTTKLNKLNIMDALGGFISLACAIHCLAVPALTVFWPFFGKSFLADAAFHSLLLYFVVPIAILSLGWGYLHHKNLKPLIVGCLSLGILVYCTIIEKDTCAHCAEIISSNGLAFWRWSTEILIQKSGMILGACFLCWAHWNNLKACKKANCTH